MSLTRITTAIGATIALAMAPTIASADVQDSYTCDPTYSNYTGCFVIKNDIQVFVGPSRLQRNRPLEFLNKIQLPCYWGGLGPYYWDAQREIAGGATGMAQLNGSLCMGGSVVYGMRQAGGGNRQAIVAMRMDSDGENEKCIESTFLDCRMGAQEESGRDSKRLFTITSRPLEVKVLNALPNALRRMDGPYWSNALGSAVADNAGEVAGGNGVGYMGGLRSVVRPSGVAAIYKIKNNADDTRFNGGTVAINIVVDADGRYTGKCTPVYAPSARPFNCTVTFSGPGKGTLNATVRVNP